MRMNRIKTVSTTLLVACAVSLFVTAAFAEATAPKKYRAVVIQGAGVVPNTMKPEGADAITGATSLGLNTYTLTTTLAEKLAALDVAVEVKPFSECKDLACLDASADGKVKAADLVIFAGPEHGGKHPKQLSALYPNLKEAVTRNPGLVCSTLVSASNPAIKGQKAVATAEAAYKNAGVKFVPGVGVITPRNGKPGATPEEVDKSMTDFAAALIAALQAPEAAQKK